MADVFISFSSKDDERVARIHANLIDRGLKVWWMHNLLPGDSPIKTVSRELESARKVVLAWSRHAEASPYVEGEMMHAFGTRKLLPVRLEKWPWPAFLSSVQYVDMTPADDETAAWRVIEARLQQTAQLESPSIAAARQPLIAAPHSAGPVRTLAALTLVLVFALVAVLAMAFQAIRDGNMPLLQLLQYSILVFPVLSAALVLLAAHRVYGAWRSRVAYLQGAAP